MTFYNTIMRLVIVASALGCTMSNPLDDYVNAPDSHYEYTVLNEARVPGQYIVYTLNMTSQKWLTDADSDKSIWWHYLMVTVPDRLTHPDHCFFWITGGSTDYNPPDPLSDTQVLRVSDIAMASGVIGATLRQIPNEPIVFTSDPLHEKRREDWMIAFTWNHFIMNGTDQPEWLARLPMTKAVVRGMDTVTDLMHKTHPGPVNVSKFVVGGESKRGWTTWTTGAVDKRVVGIAPTVMDLLNIVKNCHHHYRSLGGWTFAFSDFYRMNVTQFIDHPNVQKLADIEDPYAYVDRLTMPKLIVNAVSDEFFLPDDSYYYFDGLIGPKYLNIIPNDDHYLRQQELFQRHLYSAFVNTITMPSEWIDPQISWLRYENSTHGIIEFTTDKIPLKVESFRALTNRGNRRDFRMATLPPGATEPQQAFIIFKEFSVSNPAPGKYVAEFLTPHIGWQCFFIRAHYPAPGGTTISFTSEANITPTEKFAVPDCHGEGCTGTLV